MAPTKPPTGFPKAATFSENTTIDRGRITYDDDVQFHPRRANTAGGGSSRQRSSSRDSSLSIRTARRSIEPHIALPPLFRTLSYGIEEHKWKSFAEEDQKPTKVDERRKATEIDFKDIDYHTATVEELLTRFSTSRSEGLSSSEVSQKLKTIGRNIPSPPPSRWIQKTLGYLFGGFGSILFVAGVLVFVAWKPLGNPNPAVANLALAIVLLIVWVIQVSSQCPTMRLYPADQVGGFLLVARLL